jgi:hypothetical protein
MNERQTKNNIDHGMKWKIPKHVAQHSEAILTWVGLDQ